MDDPIIWEIYVNTTKFNIMPSTAEVQAITLQSNFSQSIYLLQLQLAVLMGSAWNANFSSIKMI